MKKPQQARFDALYQRHVNALSRQRKANNTVYSYARALRRIANQGYGGHYGMHNSLYMLHVNCSPVHHAAQMILI